MSIIMSKMLSYFVSKALAQNGPIYLTNPINTTSFSTVLQNIQNGLIGIALPLLGLMVLIGGFQIMTAGGKEEQFKKGKQTLTYAVIGFICILLAAGVVQIIVSLIG